MEKFKPLVEDDFLVAHVMAHIIPLDISTDSIKDEYGKHLGAGRTLKYGKGEKRHVELLLTSRRLMVAVHQIGSWAGSDKIQIERFETIWLTDSSTIFPRLEKSETHRGSRFRKELRMILFVREENWQPTRPIAFSITEKWFPRLLGDISR